MYSIELEKRYRELFKTFKDEMGTTQAETKVKSKIVVDDLEEYLKKFKEETRKKDEGGEKRDHELRKWVE